ncbi:glycosyltransferase family 4 protein [bacterium]|nr:glycosyltransferase family 4 protein [bacterium]
MRICHITPHYLPSFAGLTTVFRETAAEEIKQGHTVSVICYFPWEPWKLTDVSYEQIEGVDVYRLKNRLITNEKSKFSRLFMRFVFPFVFFIRIKKIRCDVIHIAGVTHLTYSAVLWSKLKRIPVVISLYGEELRWITPSADASVITRLKKRLRLMLNKIVFSSADAVTASSKSLQDELKNLKLRHDSHLIFNGVNTAKFKISHKKKFFSVKKRYKLPENSFIIGSVGGISVRKGYDILLKIFAAAFQKNSNLHLCIVGGGDVQSLRNLAVRLGVLESITFIGAVSYEELLELYPVFDIYVQLPIYEEGVSQTALEAAMFEKPVILSDCGAMRDSAVDKKSGFIVSIDEPDTIADIILKLSIDKKLCRQLGCEGRKWVGENRSYEKISKDYLTVFSQLI